MKKTWGILIIFFLFGAAVYGQDVPKKEIDPQKKHSAQDVKKKNKDKVVATDKSQTNPSTLNKEKKLNDSGNSKKVKKVPNATAKKALMKRINRKKTMGQVQQVNKAVRKTMRRHRR